MATFADLSPQNQETYLTQEAISSLKEVKNFSGTSTAKIDQRLKDALRYLRTSAEEINDRGSDERIKRNKKLKRLAKENQDEPENETLVYESFQQKVKQTTRKLDLGTRAVIDDQVWLQDVSPAVDRMVKDVTRSAKHSTQTQTQTQTQLTVDDMDDTNNEQGGGHPLTTPDLSENAVTILGNVLSGNQDSWNSTSLTDRYATNNDYIDFYRTVFDANHPGEGQPPLPHASQWFAAEEGETTRKGHSSSQRNRRQARQSETDEDTSASVEAASDGNDDAMSDIEVQAERIRLTCPITLRYFEEPLKSTKCPHAFEKKYILEWLRNSTERAPVTPEQQQELSQITQTQARARRENQLRMPIVRCPECQVPITENDLRPDPVLVRMVKRDMERQKREEEQAHRVGGGSSDNDEESDEDDVPRGTQRRKIVAIGSSPARSVRPRMSGRDIKAERNSIVPQTQLSPRDDEDEDMED